MTTTTFDRRLQKLEAKQKPPGPTYIERIIVAPASGSEDVPSVIYTLTRNPETGRYDRQ